MVICRPIALTVLAGVLLLATDAHAQRVHYGPPMAPSASNAVLPDARRNLGAIDIVSCVSDYGVVGDYSPATQTGTDNITALQACYDAATAAGKTAYLPGGNYKISGCINTDTNTQTWWQANTGRPVTLWVDGILYATGSNCALQSADSNIIGHRIYIRGLVGPGAGTSAPTPGGGAENIGLYLQGTTGQNITIGSIADFTYGVLFDGAYANKVSVGEVFAAYKAVYFRTGAGAVGNGYNATANRFSFTNVGGIYTQNGDPAFAARQARSSYWGIHLAAGNGGNYINGGAAQYAVKGAAPVNVQIDSDHNTFSGYIEGAVGGGSNLVVTGNSNVLRVSSLATPSSNNLLNVSITGVGNRLYGQVLDLVDSGLTTAGINAPMPIGAVSIAPGNVINGNPVAGGPYGHNIAHPDLPVSASAHNLVGSMFASGGLTVGTVADKPKSIDQGGAASSLTWGDNATYWWTSGILTGGVNCLRAGIWLKATTNSANFGLLVLDNATGNTLAHVEDYLTAAKGWYYYSTQACGLAGYGNVKLRLAVRNQTAGQNGAVIYAYNPFLTADINSVDSINKAALEAPDTVQGRVFPDAPIMMAGYKLNGHPQVTGSAPAVSACGTSPAIAGSDVAGEVTMGTGNPTGCIITFAQPYTAAPYCTVTWQATPLASQSYAVSATAITLTQTATSSNKVNYHCIARAGG